MSNPLVLENRTLRNQSKKVEDFFASIQARNVELERKNALLEDENNKLKDDNNLWKIDYNQLKDDYEEMKQRVRSPSPIRVQKTIEKKQHEKGADTRHTIHNGNRREEEHYTLVPSKTNIYIEYFYKDCEMNPNDFLKFLKECYDINSTKIHPIGQNKMHGKLILPTQLDQTKFLDNKDDIATEIGLKGKITICNDKK